MANPHPPLENLIQWQPGQSGNPAGRPKNEPLITPRLRRFAQMMPAEIQALVEARDRNELCVADAMALTMLEKAIKDKEWGDRTRETIIARLDGEPDKNLGLSVEVNVGVKLAWSDGEQA